MEVFEMDGITASAISATTAAAFTSIAAVYKRLTTKLDDCESKHAATNAELLVVSTRMANVEGRMEGFEAGKAKTVSETDTT